MATASRFPTTQQTGVLPDMAAAVVILSESRALTQVTGCWITRRL